MSEENKIRTAATADDDKKKRMMAAISAPPAALPTMFKTKALEPKPEPEPIKATTAENVMPEGEATPQAAAPKAEPNFKKMVRQGQKRDPIAGKALSDMVRSSYYLTESELRDFKVLATINGHSMTELVRKAVQDYIKANRNLLPRR